MLDHLVTANSAYFPIFEKVLSGEKKNTFWESLPWLPAIWGKMVIRAVNPESTRKLKAPKVFYPSSSSIDGVVIHRFIDQQNQVIRYMKATEDLDLEKIKISSPVSNLITYSLMDAYRIVITHEKRHFLQATRVSEMDLSELTYRNHRRTGAALGRVLLGASLFLILLRRRSAGALRVMNRLTAVAHHRSAPLCRYHWHGLYSEACLVHAS